MILWISLLLFGFASFAAAVYEGLEAVDDMKGKSLSPDYRGPACGPYEKNRFYRIMGRTIVSTLPILVTLTVFFFPAVVNP